MSDSTALVSPAVHAPGVEAFTFGDPAPVLDGREVFDYLECWFNGRYYDPPLSLDGLAKATRASVYLDSGLKFKRNLLARTFIPHPLLSRAAFEQLALDYLWCGNAYLERRQSRLGTTISLQPPLAKYMRRGEEGRFFQVRGWQDEHEFAPGTICHLREADINQEIYGLPEYLAALNAAWLNESATLFRRKYYHNGSHAGFIMYVTDSLPDGGYVDDIREAMKNSKGPGNFRNLFVYAPGGKKDGLQIIPVSEVAARDDFFNIKNVSRDDVLAAHRVPPQLMGLVPTNSGGFGTPISASKVFARNELEPLQAKFLEINDWLGDEVVRFKPYTIAGEGDE